MIHRRRRVDRLVFLVFLVLAAGSVWAWVIADRALDRVDGAVDAVAEQQVRQDRAQDVLERTALVQREQAKRIQQQRAESIGLLCDINGVLVAFIEQPPDLPRDRPALERLRAERCESLLADIRRSP